MHRRMAVTLVDAVLSRKLFDQGNNVSRNGTVPEPLRSSCECERVTDRTSLCWRKGGADISPLAG